jgi:isopentenyl diphosphate isomerase/L-lactate dehydrogenase-like FMN-dependent dehydrogenase
MKTKILGREVNIPFGVAPIAMQKLIHSDGEILAAK